MIRRRGAPTTVLNTLFVAAWFATGATAAQEPDTSARVAYEATWFQKYAPQTALDMLNRTPGFTLAMGGDARRGLAVGNVLIDGEHPGAKNQTLSVILQRIPAKQVARIEILRGAEIAGDPSGAVVLANVVRSAAAGAGAWSLGIEHAPDQAYTPNGSLSWSGRAGSTLYSVGTRSRTSDRDYPGTRRVLDGSGNLSAWRTDASPRDYAEHAVSAEMSRTRARGRIALTGEVSFSRYREDSTLATTSPAGEQLEEESNPYDGATRAYEGGLTFARKMGSWDMELAALLNRRRTAVYTRSTQRDGADLIDAASMQALERDSGESIAHVNLARTVGAHFFEAGMETALNTLDARTNLWRDDGAGWLPAYLPNANLRVAEMRQETFAGYAWKARGPWSLEARLTAESSRLDLEGDANRSVDLVFWKPLLQIARMFGARNQLQIRLFRDVGQLNFDDFVSAPSLADDVVNGGNPSLRPQTSWRTEVAADLRMGDDAALNIRGFHYRIGDAVDLVSLGGPGSTAVAPANIGNATITGVDLGCNLPLREFIPGGVFGFAATLQESAVDDPITREPRAISDFQPARFRAEFRQDIVDLRLAWGINYSQTAQTRRFSPTETDSRRGSPALDLFFETHAIEALKVRLSAFSILGASDLRERSFYSPDRSGSITSVESSERRPGSWWLLSLTGEL